MTILFILIITISLILLIEFLHEFRLNSPLVLKPTKISINENKLSKKYTALIEILNPHKKMEVMIPSFKVIPSLIGINNKSVKSKTYKYLNQLIKEYPYEIIVMNDHSEPFNYSKFDANITFTYFLCKFVQ